MSRIVVKFEDEDGTDFGLKRTGNVPHVNAHLTDSSDSVITVQNPLPTDSDSVYTKDIDLTVSSNGNFQPDITTGAVGSVLDYFDSLISVNVDSTTDNPKSILVWFYRSVYAHAIGLGCNDLTKGFGTDVTVKLLGSGQVVRFTKNFTGIDSNSALLEFGPKAFNGFILEFNTASSVALSNLTIRKAIEAAVTLQALKPDGTIINVDATAGGNLKVSLEELESAVSDDSNTALKVSPYAIDEYNTIARLLCDNIFKGALITIPPEHHEIHCGDRYSARYTADLANGASMTFALIVPNEGLVETNPGDAQTTKQYHAVFYLDVEAEATIIGYEGATLSANGIAIPVGNRNRNSTNVDYLSLYHSPTVADPGSVFLSTIRLGSGKVVGGKAGRGDEFILKDNTTYLFTVTNATTSNNYFNIELDYYVHPGV